MQAMDPANVCLVSMELIHEGFDPYRCDKNIILGINLAKSVHTFKIVTFMFY